MLSEDYEINELWEHIIALERKVATLGMANREYERLRDSHERRITDAHERLTEVHKLVDALEELLQLYERQ